jgi:hypothetical protein
MAPVPVEHVFSNRVAVMSDIYSVLQSSYAASATSAAAAKAARTPYTNVDPTLFQGSWTGTYTKNNQKFSLQISNVHGFRAQVKLETGGTVTFQNVLIKSNAFRIGDTKFALSKKGVAQVNTAISNPVTGAVSLITGTANQS